MTLKEFEKKYIKQNESQLVLVAGRPAMGKTSFTQSMAIDFNSVLVENGNGLTISEIQEKLERNIGETNLIIVDYLQLINQGNEGLDKVIDGLKKLSTAHSCPVLVISQLPRDIEERDDHMPRLEDLAVAGLNSDDFDEIMLLYREHYYDRHSDPGKITVVTKSAVEELTWDEEACIVL